jgi:hypothetical protein
MNADKKSEIFLICVHLRLTFLAKEPSVRPSFKCGANDPSFSSSGKCAIVLTKGDLAIDAEAYG